MENNGSKPKYHELLQKQLDAASHPDGTTDLDLLFSNISYAYQDQDTDRKRRERTMEVMSQEVMLANKELMFQAEELRVAKERYELASEAANDAMWEWDVLNDRVYYSSRWKEMLMIPDSNEMTCLDQWFSLIHAKDLKAVKSALIDHKLGKSKRINIEYRIKKLNGEVIWVLMRGLAAKDEHGKVTRIAGSQTDISETKKSREALEKAAFHDDLTGLPKRIILLDRLKWALARSQRINSPPAALLFIDLDRFKYINDTLGHEMGNQVLLTVADVLKNIVRAEDTVCRLGGDEFVVLINDTQDLEDAKEIANRILSELNRSYVLSGKEVRIAASIGLFLIDNSNMAVEEVIRNADSAMYNAKTKGKSCLEVFDFAQHQRNMDKLALESELRTAISQGQLHTQFQPIVDLYTGQIAAFEALARWYHPARGQVSPAKFIPIAEETGQIAEIGQFVLHESIGLIREWVRKSPDIIPPKISINVSVKQLSDIQRFEDLIGILNSCGNIVSRICLEVTESVIMTNPEIMRARLSALKEAGVGLSIDDFGTGFSSLSYLNTFPFDTLKIDQSFTSTMTSDEKSRKLVTGILNIARDLGLNTVAEGIETVNQLNLVRSLGCAYGQGFLFAKSLTLEEVETIRLNQTKFNLGAANSFDAKKTGKRKKMASPRGFEPLLPP